MPVVGEVVYARGTEEDPASGLWSYADRTKEVVRPGYYAVPLVRYGVTAEMTATSRVGLHRYTFPASQEAAVVFDLENGGCWDKATETGFRVSEDSTRIWGWRYSTGWAKDQKVYFAAEFEKPFEKFETVGEHYGRASFTTTDGEQLLVKVAPLAREHRGCGGEPRGRTPRLGLRSRGCGGRCGMEQGALESAHHDLGRGGPADLLHGAVSHVVAPSEFCDADGSYRGADGQVHGNPGYKTHTTFSLWDTYRAAMR